ncbi:hypothetical protein ODZ84_03690 [Chryseobacterium fluminis]|uniref:hypothetical protein n=1 Tax=Chryseobacterium fluminis TaxID=2983606 RepID=UPI00225B54BB|nr:hypothetical protein [Chryseobacterium sp. MMS21-Ot14]UZT98689.1 hypothetical protein ODZ84_03690 [Chryseobacterium sp. MMS21-Ot14]
MKKTILLGAILLAGVVSAFPFRTSCGVVLQVNEAGIDGMSYGQVVNTLKLMNGITCGTTDVGIVVYNH